MSQLALALDLVYLEACTYYCYSRHCHTTYRFFNTEHISD